MHLLITDPTGTGNLREYSTSSTHHERYTEILMRMKNMHMMQEVITARIPKEVKERRTLRAQLRSMARSIRMRRTPPRRTLTRRRGLRWCTVRWRVREERRRGVQCRRSGTGCCRCRVARRWRRRRDQRRRRSEWGGRARIQSSGRASARRPRTWDASGKWAAGRGSCKKPEEVEKGIHRAAIRRLPDAVGGAGGGDYRFGRHADFGILRFPSLVVVSPLGLLLFCFSLYGNVCFSPLSCLESMLLKEIN